MTVNEAIAQVDTLKPNAYSTGEKVRWLSELDGQITDEILRRVAGGAAERFIPYDALLDGSSALLDGDTELIATGTYADLYVKYLCAQVDYHNGEWTRYNNSAAMFSAAWDGYAAYMRRTHPPGRGAKIRV